MFRTIGSAMVVTLALAVTPAVIGNTVLRSALHDYRVVTVVDGLVQPWSIAFLPGGDALITERPGRLRILRQGKLLPQPVDGVPKVFHSSQAGLLEVMPHPDFGSNRLIYLSFSKPGATDAQATTTLVRGRFDGTALTGVEQLFEAVTQGRNHFGGKIAFDRSGYLFLTLGDRQVPPEGKLEAHPAQDLTNHHGKIIRLHDDGRVPADNPFVNRPGARPEIWSYGHRNVQGLAMHPETGDIWANEHGPQGGDELNLVQPGRNYGWPVIGFGVSYTTGAAIHAGTLREGMEQPAQVWVPSIGISGALFYTGNRFPEWRGSLFVGGMARPRLTRLTLNGRRIVGEETLVPQMGRIRDIRQGPDGDIYLVTDNREGKPTPILRLEPVPRAPVE
jgi:glucose/arabinose dehydrogenase